MQGKEIFIPKGKFAADDAALKAQREALKKRLMEGGKVTLKPDGNVMGGSKNDGNGISIPRGKLAYLQWYQRDPELLAAEKTAMYKFWPGFEMNKLKDGRLCWQGELCPGVYETKFGHRKTYYVMAVYNDNHPEQVMGSSVRVYPILPDVDDLIRECGFRPYHLLSDSDNNYYLCTNEAGDVSTGSTVTSAASVLTWAVKWLTCFELVLTGDLDREAFNQHGII